MNTSQDNVQKMIAAFIAYDQDSSKDTQKADDLLQTLLDNSKLPLTQWKKTGRKDKHGDDVTVSKKTRTAAEKDEIAQMRELLGSREADALWTTAEDLRDLIVTYPPVIMERLLVAAIAIRILRHDEINMETESDAFNEFYAGWGAVVIAA